ncbi:MAG TPA: hypothetical protein VLN08_12380 [Vicinamibacterales bacterium]|nr:hypothetical protein [Vicinamibacterales bacterium]
MAKETAKKTAKTSREAGKLRAGDYVIPRVREGCRVKVGSVELVIPRGKEGCRVTVEEV